MLLLILEWMLIGFLNVDVEGLCSTNALPWLMDTFMDTLMDTPLKVPAVSSQLGKRANEGAENPTTEQPNKKPRGVLELSPISHSRMFSCRSRNSDPT